ILLFGSLTYAIIEAPKAGWLSTQSIVLFALAATALAALAPYERRRREPLLDPRFFRSVPFASASVIAVSAFAALGGFLFLNTLYLQEARGLSALQAGLCTLPMAGATALVSPFSGRLVASRGTRLPLQVAGIAMTLGMVPLTWARPDTPIWQLLIGYLLFGIGF